MYSLFSHAALLPPARVAAGELDACWPAPHLRESARPRQSRGQPGGEHGGSREGSRISDDCGGDSQLWGSGGIVIPDPRTP
jgi:hypothetical protein